MLAGMGGGGGRGGGRGGALAPNMPQMLPFSGGVSKSERMLCANTDGSVEQVTANIEQAVQQFGPSPGAKKMMKAEQAAAEEAVRSGLYGVWRNMTNGSDFCSRIGPHSRCFCGCGYSDHQWSAGRRELAPACTKCPCKQFKYIPRRPEEVGEWWLPRRRGFDINMWRAKCKCNHGHDQHDPNNLRCPASGGRYTSAWLCVCCEGKWEDHESLWESEQERRMENKPVGEAFMPLTSTPGIHQAIFNPSPEEEARSHSLPHRPRPERAVRLMQERCPNYGGGGLEDAFPPRGAAARRAAAGGSLEDSFPPHGGSTAMLEDADPRALGTDNSADSFTVAPSSRSVPPGGRRQQCSPGNMRRPGGTASPGSTASGYGGNGGVASGGRRAAPAAGVAARRGPSPRGLGAGTGLQPGSSGPASRTGTPGSMGAPASRKQR